MLMRFKKIGHSLLPFGMAIALAGCVLRLGWPSGSQDSPAPTTVPLSALTPEAAQLATPPATASVATTSAATDIPPSGAQASSAPQASGLPIQLPPGFHIAVFAEGLESPRMLALGPDGVIYAAERGAGRIVRFPDRNGDGVSDSLEVVADGLSSPSSLAFYQDGSLYVGETTRVLRLSDPDAGGVFQKQAVIVDGLPSGGHSTRTVLFSPDWTHLFVSVGSSCNVCQEKDERRAAILRFNPDGSGGEVFGRGLRNAVGITFRPGTDELWATNNGRDLMGDDLPPETVNLVHQGDDFGWPRCHAGRIPDPEFGGANACQGVAQPVVEMQAHSAPLGLAFYTGSQFPAEYQGNLFVAFHGSWNRSTPTGYKVVRIPMQGSQPGPVEDFAVGWLESSGQSFGRPVDVLTGADGSLYVSDDGGGKIYRISYAG